MNPTTLTKGASEPDESGIADFVKSLETNDRRRCLGDASPEERVSETIPDSARRGAESKRKEISTPKGAKSKGKKDSRPKESGIEDLSDHCQCYFVGRLHSAAFIIVQIS